MLFIINFCDLLLQHARNPRMNCDEKARDRLTVCEEALIGFRASREQFKFLVYICEIKNKS